MKFILKTKPEGRNTILEENYDAPDVENLEQAKGYALGLLKRFNNTLKPSEGRREFIGVEKL